MYPVPLTSLSSSVETMPAVGPGYPILRKTKRAFPSDPRSMPPSSSSKALKRFRCHAWWCKSTFARRADMMKHMGTEHLGKRIYCPICHLVMKQGSNMRTHVNRHFDNKCTACSCNRRFTDPSAYTKHRESSGHAKGATHGQPRPEVVKGIEVQHTAGLELNVDMISDPTFIPPPFDTSYHLRGMPKSKGEERYHPTIYIELPKVVDLPAVHAGGSLPMAYASQYEENGSPPAQSQIREEDISNADYSYDVVLPQDDMPLGAEAYAECYNFPDGSLALPPVSTNPHLSQVPVEHHFTQGETVPPREYYPALDTHAPSYATHVDNITFSNPYGCQGTYAPPTATFNINSGYFHGYQETYAPAVDDVLPHPPSFSTGPNPWVEYQGISYPPPTSYWSIDPPSFEMPHQYQHNIPALEPSLSPHE